MMEAYRGEIYHQTVQTDWDCTRSSKQRGGGLTLYINNRWCNPGHITLQQLICCPDIELLAVGRITCSGRSHVSCWWLFKPSQDFIIHSVSPLYRCFTLRHEQSHLIMNFLHQFCPKFSYQWEIHWRNFKPQSHYLFLFDCFNSSNKGSATYRQ